jgi:hypothetical protein
MFVVWGKKRVRKKIGHVADFCPMCRTAQPFALVRVGVLLVASQIALSGRRFMKRKVIPVLAASLRPLRPSQEELRGVLSELKLLKQKIGTKMKLTDLEDGIAAPFMPVQARLAWPHAS